MPSNPRLLLVPKTLNKIQKYLSKAESCFVTFLAFGTEGIVAEVSFGTDHNAPKNIVHFTKCGHELLGSCTCRRALELLHPCKCMVAVLFRAGQRMENEWSLFDNRLYNSHHFTSSWARQYSMDTPVFTTYDRKSLAREKLRPWSKPPAFSGRKKKIGINREKKADGIMKRCSGCGTFGHNVRRCSSVNLDEM